MGEHRSYNIAVAVLILLRFVVGAVLPLSADEAYYWLWSKHLAAGYYDHPPAIAFLIRAGVTVFGDASFGIRVVPLLLSIAASWFVWRAGASILKDERAGVLSCLLFNLTLMVAVETMAATPDAPLIFCSAAFLWALAKVDETQDGRWWLIVGAAGGLALLSKYTAFFLGA
ncbi:MAG TPA: glycosyltransferase family 39 protein, partial [Rhizomicrobium sp.]|nr:glycosyltransferase family 39 protein [Rhizomicrobium sp.]